MLGKCPLFGLSAASLIRERALVSLIALVFAATINAEEPISESADTVLNRAELFYSKKKYEDARREYERAIAIDKGSLAAWRGLAWSLWALGKKERAYEIWSGLVDAFPDDASILLALAKASEQDRHWTWALDSYSRILRILPDDKQARLGRARIFLAQRNYKPAEQEIRTVLKHTRSDAEADSLLADALIGQQRYQDAESILRRLTEADPAPEHLRRLAYVLAELGRYQDAASYYRKCLLVRRDEGLLAAWRNLGSKLRRLERNQEAYEIWQGLLRDFPDDVPTLLAVGRASEQDQLWSQALDYYALVLRKAPDDEAARLGSARPGTGLLGAKRLRRGRAGNQSPAGPLPRERESPIGAGRQSGRHRESRRGGSHPAVAGRRQPDTRKLTPLRDDLGRSREKRGGDRSSETESATAAGRLLGHTGLGSRLLERTSIR